MAFIVQNIVQADTRLQIGAEEILRPMQIGARWTKIRIGVRLFMHCSATFNAADLLIGVAQGTKGFSAIDCTDAIACKLSDYPTGSASMVWSYNALGFVTVNITSFGFSVQRKVGAQLTQTNGASTIQPIIPASPNANTLCSGLYVDITKTATGISVVNAGASSQPSGLANLTRSAHLINMESEKAIVTTNGQTYSISNAAAVNFSSAQLWDTVLVSWSRTLPVIDIHDVTVTRFY